MYPREFRVHFSLTELQRDHALSNDQAQRRECSQNQCKQFEQALVQALENLVPRQPASDDERRHQRIEREGNGGNQTEVITQWDFVPMNSILGSPIARK